MRERGSDSESHKQDRQFNMTIVEVSGRIKNGSREQKGGTHNSKSRKPLECV